MKRMLSFALSILMLCSLAACAKGQPHDAPSPGSEAADGDTDLDMDAAGDGTARFTSSPSADTEADASGTAYLLFGTRMVLHMPEDWSFFCPYESAPWAFFSPDADAEFDVFPLEIRQGETVGDLFSSLRERFDAGDADVRELAEYNLKDCACLMYVDGIGQNCAYVRRSDTEGYYFSCTDRGDDGAFFRERLESVHWIAEGAPSPYVRQVEKYEGYSFDLENAGLRTYIPKEFSLVEYEDDRPYCKFQNADGTKRLILSCAFSGEHTSPNRSAEIFWKSSSKNADTQMTAEVSAQGRSYVIWQSLSTGKLEHAYVLGNHGYTVNFLGDLSVPQMRYFLDQLEDIEVKGVVNTDYYDSLYEHKEDDSRHADDDGRCGVCRGTGVCVGCNGRRRIRIPGFSGVGSARYVNCGACGGTGRCRTCGGTGRE